MTDKSRIESLEKRIQRSRKGAGHFVAGGELRVFPARKEDKALQPVGYDDVVRDPDLPTAG